MSAVTPEQAAYEAFRRWYAAENEARTMTQDFNESKYEAMRRAFNAGTEAHAAIAAAAPASPATDDLRPREGERGWHDVTCGACGREWGTNFAIEEIECPECGARRCPHCATWFGGESDDDF